MPAGTQINMVGVEVQLTLDNRNFYVKQISYGVNRNADERGMVSEAPKCMLIRMLIEPIEYDEFELLYAWAFGDEEKDGVIIFKFQNDSEVLRQVSFEKAKCIGFREQFLSQSQSTLRPVDIMHVPNRSEYSPRNRGRDYFLHGYQDGRYQELVLKPEKIEIDHTTIPNV